MELHSFSLFLVEMPGIMLWVLFVAIASLILLCTLDVVFKHENLTITPTRFKIKRNLEWAPSQRDSVKNSGADAEGPTFLDKILRRHVSGHTRNLQKAEVRTSSDSF